MIKARSFISEEVSSYELDLKKERISLIIARKPEAKRYSKKIVLSVQSFADPDNPPASKIAEPHPVNLTELLYTLKREGPVFLGVASQLLQLREEQVFREDLATAQGMNIEELLESMKTHAKKLAMAGYVFAGDHLAENEPPELYLELGNAIMNFLPQLQEALENARNYAAATKDSQNS